MHYKNMQHMIKIIIISISQAIENIRSNFFHTILSVLGIVIGVSALVTILSFIDGMEKYAKEQILVTTDLNILLIQTNPYKSVNGVRIKKENFEFINLDKYEDIISTLSYPSEGYLSFRKSAEISRGINDSTVGVNIVGTLGKSMFKVLEGEYFTSSDVDSKSLKVVINTNLAKLLGASDEDYKKVIGQTLNIHDTLFYINGVVENKSSIANAFIPFSHFSEQELKANPPELYIEAKDPLNVPLLKAELESFLKIRKGDSTADFSIITNEFRVDQVNKGFLLFRIIMGLIVGISVIVGGIGVMNVLLISVTERTAEIGIRKAVGAKPKDIALLFLMESVTVSTFGSILGLLFGIIISLGALPIIRGVTEMQFEVIFTVNTMIIIGVIAILIGIVFGTYPALRASKLDPVEAIRKGEA
jgi:putative ABC transport system permease protein